MIFCLMIFFNSNKKYVTAGSANEDQRLSMSLRLTVKAAVSAQVLARKCALHARRRLFAVRGGSATFWLPVSEKYANKTVKFQTFSHS